MSNPFGGVYGTLFVTMWVAEAPTGRDEAFLMLTTADHRANVTMRHLAELLDLRPGAAPSLAPMTTAHIELGADGWAALVIGGERFERPATSEWVDLTNENRRVVLVVGTAPLPAGMDPDHYIDRHGGTTAIGLAPLRRS